MRSFLFSFFFQGDQQTTVARRQMWSLFLGPLGPQGVGSPTILRDACSLPQVRIILSPHFVEVCERWAINEKAQNSRMVVCPSDARQFCYIEKAINVTNCPPLSYCLCLCVSLFRTGKKQTSPATAAFPTNKRGETTRNGSNYQRRGGKHSIMAVSCLLHPAGPNGAAFSARRTEKDWRSSCTIAFPAPRLACRKFETRHSKFAPPSSAPPFPWFA